MNTWAIEATCFTVTERSLFVGDLPGVLAYLNDLSAKGWQIAAAYQLDVPASDGAPRAPLAGDTNPTT